MVLYFMSVLLFFLFENNLYLNEKINEKQKIEEYKKEIKEHVSLLKKIDGFEGLSFELNEYIKDINININKSKTLMELDLISLSYLINLGNYVENYKEQQTLIKKD